MAPFNSAMPAWKATMAEEQRWQVITYLRTFGQ
jgi:mono/diheme cytochrome c family protein